MKLRLYVCECSDDYKPASGVFDSAHVVATDLEAAREAAMKEFQTDLYGVSLRLTSVVEIATKLVIAEDAINHLDS